MMDFGEAIVTADVIKNIEVNYQDRLINIRHDFLMSKGHRWVHAMSIKEHDDGRMFFWKFQCDREAWLRWSAPGIINQMIKDKQDGFRRTTMRNVPRV